MKKNYLLTVLLLLLCSQFLSAQITEAFDNEANNATSFSEGGISFNITSQQSYFRVQGSYPGTGWNGAANDNKYLDNSNYTSSSQGVKFTVTTANGAAITLKSMWIYVSTSGLNLSPIGTLTITGKRAGETVYAVSRSNPFNPSASTNNGFTLFDMATLGGQDNSNVVIDQYEISTDMGIGYLSVDAVKFQCAPVSLTSTTQTNVSCYGGNNGAASVTIAPSGTLGYDWAPGNPAGDGTASVTGLTAGTWTCTVTNACGSTNTATFNIGAPAAALSAETSQTSVNCYGNSTGGAGVTPSGGTSPYTYLWSTGATTQSITNKSSGNYSVTITDAKGCTLTKNITIIQPVAALSASTSQTNVLCYGAATGTASVTPSGGTSPYTYLWSNGQTTASISNITSGNYSVTITDANGCTLVKNITITQPGTAISATTSQAGAVCYGNSTGSAGVTASGGTGTYTYLWSNGATTATVSNIVAGNYTVTVTDANGCTITKNITVTQPTAPISATTSQTNILCYGNTTGSAGVSASGGTPGYTYLWNTGATTASVSAIAAGNYTVTITDANGCTLIKNITITQPAAALSATTSYTDALCYGNTTGSASVTASGGTIPYTYLWNTGDTTASVSNIAAGNYSVTITDANGCTLTKNISIAQPAAPLNATATNTDAICSGSSTGSASVVASGGTAPYTYVWSTGQDTAAITGLPSGNYSVTVTDANGCTVTKSVTINEPAAPLSVSVAATLPLCNGEANGTATANITNGVGPYTYLWSNGQQTATATGLSAGDYTVTVTDSNMCTATETFIMYQPGAVSIGTVYVNNAICHGSATGSVYINNMNGGTYPFTYQWSNGATGNNISNLAAGTYSVVITDANGCTITASMAVGEPATGVSASFTQSNINCYGSVTGSVTIIPSGGIAPYDYQIFPSGQYFNASTVTDLAAGDYSIIVRDAYNCNTTLYFTITQPDAPLAATTAQTDVVCYGMGAQGSATVYPTGGTPPYTYEWSYGAGNEATATGLGATAYTVTVTDANNCSIQKTVTIENTGECGTTTTWNGTQWSNGAPACEAYAVVFEGDYNSAEYGDMVACSITVNSGNVVIASGNNISIMNAVSVLGGSLTFESGAYLIQYTTTQNVGEITYKRDSSPLYNLDYTMWSSPVTGNQSLKDFSPQTLDARFYVYNTALNAFSNYLSASGVFGGNPDSEPFVAGKGYLIRMPDGISEEATTVFTGAFQGTPNNGDVSIPLSTGGTRFNAVGNPYPSPLRLYTFVMGNQENLDNGTVYFWRKRNGSTETTYTTVSLAGSVESGGESGEGGSEGGEGNQAYMFSIRPGQGFFVKASSTATTLNFNNYMRWSNDNSGQFFKTANDEPGVTDSKLWLNITNDAGVFGQAAIAYMENTTLNLDYGYDGRLYNDGVASLYTTAQDTKLSIQARDVFTAADEVPLSYKTSVGGNFTISLDHYTGLFSQGQDIYLKDAMLSITHDLKNSGSYNFVTEPGTFDGRFTVVYQQQTTAGLEEFMPQSIIAYKNANTIIINSGTAVMQSIEVYDIHGRLLYANDDVNASDAKVTRLAAQEQMLIVQVTTTEGNKVSKKIIY